jgi:putative endonuclease
MTKTWRQTLGKWGEAAAASYLIEQGLSIVTQNYRCAQGEIDLIAQEGAAIVFVEVKTRSSAAFGNPEEAVDGAKQAHLLAAAETYCEENALLDQDWRMDVISIIGNPGRKKDIKILWYKNAFDGS